MNNNATAIETLFEKASEYGKTSIELYKLQAIDKTAEVVSSLATRLVITIVVALFIVSANIGLALWIGELLGKTYYGFFVIAGAWALIALLVYAFRNQWIKEPVSNTMIIKMLQQKEI
ncbi:hypothetical protein [Ferruginibacter sp. SUN106]|uniref:hypothetical protein n=1 Tax=Ferruginibacter sp. SUN106 TaxID=2978348 RepID=UPI003D35B916